MGFTKLGLSDQLLEGVRAAGYTTPTPIQLLTILPALEGKDIIGCAQTGTGKTAAFVLPVLHRLSDGKRTGRLPRALIVTPTRELAQQVHDAFRDYGKHTRLRWTAIYGGVGMEPQIRALRHGVDIIIATPGRLLDHMERGSVDLSGIRTIVLDEADRMLDMGFIHDMKKILHRLPAERQTLLFSATISDQITTLAKQFLRNPEIHSVGERRNPAETVTMYFYSVEPGAKSALLSHIIEQENMGSVLVFSRTKHGADKIAKRLARKGIAAAVLHSNRTQGQRQRALDGFKEGKHRVLVATDIAARGIDVEGISHVINFDIPQYAEDYIHRIGRTGRAGAVGDAITLVGAADRQYLRRIESFVGRKFQVRSYAGFTGQISHPSVEGETKSNESRPVSNSGRARRPKPSHKNRSRRDGTWKSARKDSRGGRSKVEVAPVRKRKRATGKFETYSSDGGGAWSNY